MIEGDVDERGRDEWYLASVRMFKRGVRTSGRGGKIKSKETVQDDGQRERKEMLVLLKSERREG